MARQNRPFMPYEKDIFALVADKKLHRHSAFVDIMVAHGRHKAQTGPVLGKLIKHGELQVYQRAIYGLPGLLEDTEIVEVAVPPGQKATTKACPCCGGSGRVPLGESGVG